MLDSIKIVRRIYILITPGSQMVKQNWNWQGEGFKTKTSHGWGIDIKFFLDNKFQNHQGQMCGFEKNKVG